MKTIMFTYPGFQSLPRGIKQMLVTSETLFFAETGTNAANTRSARPGNAGLENAKITQFPAVMRLGGASQAFATA
jgi:hypothetical protein